MANAMASVYRFTVIRLTDKAERFARHLPGPKIRKSPDFLVWDNEKNEPVT
jgi:hypothetical protein